MASPLDRSLRYSNYAEELRIIAADATTTATRRTLLKVAAEYEDLAKHLEAIAKSKRSDALD